MKSYIEVRIYAAQRKRAQLIILYCFLICREDVLSFFNIQIITNWKEHNLFFILLLYHLISLNRFATTVDIWWTIYFIIHFVILLQFNTNFRGENKAKIKTIVVENFVFLLFNTREQWLFTYGILHWTLNLFLYAGSEMWILKKRPKEIILNM